MFGNLRSEDAQLFEQLARITRDIARSSIQLEQLLTEPRAAADASDSTPLVTDDASPPDEEDVRVVTGFTMRLGATEFRELALVLDATAEAVHEAIAHVESLDSHDAPRGVLALAHTLSSAASALQRAVPLAGEGRDMVERGDSDVQRIADAGETIYFDGVAELFAGRPEALHVLRWKDIYEKLWHGLENCARAAVVLDQLARTNT